MLLMKSMMHRKGKADGLGHSRAQAVTMTLLFALLPLEKGEVAGKPWGA